MSSGSVRPIIARKALTRPTMTKLFQRQPPRISRVARIQPIDVSQAVCDCRSCPVVIRLDQEALRSDIRELIGVKTLVRLRQQKQGLPIWDHPRHSPAGLVQQGFAAGQGAKLLGTVVAGNLASQGKKPFAISSRQNHGPTSGLATTTQGPQRGGVLVVHVL